MGNSDHVHRTAENFIEDGQEPVCQVLRST